VIPSAEADRHLSPCEDAARGRGTYVKRLMNLNAVSDTAKILHAGIRDGSFLTEGGTNLLYELRP
jgi:hypothetical protein